MTDERATELPPSASGSASAGGHRRRSVGLVAVGLLVALALAFLVAPHASSSPDGLERVAADRGIDTDARASAVAGSPLADYAVRGVDDTALSTGTAGAIGIAVVFVLTFGLARSLRITARRRIRAAGTTALPGR